jgi:hypothetical protein
MENIQHAAEGHAACRESFTRSRPGRPGRLAAQTPHRPGRADFPHPVPRREASLRDRQRRW